MKIDRITPSSPEVDTDRARLIVLSGDHVGRKYIFTDEIIVGRSHDVAVSLDDPQVSRKHARIIKENDTHFIEDLGSRNGTVVNNQPVERQKLVFGDRIKIGKRTTLLFTHIDPIEDQILHRQKMEAIGRLGAGIAHDFNNLLGALVSSLDYLESQPDGQPLDDKEIKECLSDMRIAVSRGSDLTRRLLGFASRKHNSLSAVDLSLLCEEVIHLAQRTFPKSIEIEYEIRPKLILTGDSAALHQLIMNLFINARDAMIEGGEIKITTELISADAVEGLPLSASGYYAKVTVRDTGVGMDAETKKRIFEPFFTTKPGNIGSGLGLATVYEVAISHGGHVEVESEMGQGTCFYIYLPAGLQPKEEVTPKPTIRARNIPTPGSGITRPATILLVDDNEVVRRSASRLLSLDAHKVIHASNGREAVEIYQQMETNPDLVMLDLDMPVMGGEETFQHLLHINPEIRVIFVSGYLNDEREVQLTRMGAWGFLRKPFNSKSLKEKIHQVLTSDNNPLQSEES